MEPALQCKEVFTKDKRFRIQIMRGYSPAMMYKTSIYIDDVLLLVNYWSENAYELATQAMVRLAEYVAADQWNEW